MKKDHMIAHIVKTDCRIPKSNAYWFKVLLASFYIFNCSNLLLAGDYSGTATCPVTHTGCVYSDNIYSPKEETSRAIFGFKDNQLDYNEYYRAYAFVDLTSIPSGVAIAGGDIDIGAVVEENVRNQSIGIRVNILPYEFNDWNSKGLADKWSSLDESGPNLLNEWTNSGGWYQISLDPFLDWFVSRSELGFKYKINPESITDFPSIPDNDSILFAASIESLEIDYCYWPSELKPSNTIESPYTDITLRWEGELLNPLKYHVQWSRQSFGGTLIDNGEDYTTGTSYNIYCRANERIEWRVRLVNPECDNCNSIWAQDFDFYTGTLMEGYVRTVTGEPLEGVTLTFNYGGGSTTTNAEGFYSQELPYGWPADGDETGIVTPTKSGYSFEPRKYDTSSDKWYSEDHIGHPILTPSIAKSRTSIEFGSSVSTDTFQVWNDGTGTLSYSTTISEGGSYFSVTPSSGSSTGSSDKKTHTVTVNRDNISPGQTVAGMVKIAADADDSPQYITLSANKPDPTVTLTGLSISGDSSIPEDSYKSYTAMASWSEGSPTNVTSSTTWSVSSYGHFVGNTLYNDNTSGSNKSVKITASYTFGGIVKEDEKDVLLVAVVQNQNSSLEVWGSNSSGQISNIPSGYDFVDIATGSKHCVALRSDGSLESWGSDAFGQLRQTPQGNDFVAVTAGEWNSGAIRGDGSIEIWGPSYWNNQGQMVQAPTGTNFIGLTLGRNCYVAIRSDGSLESNCSNIPDGTGFILVAAGWEHYVALKSDGSLEVWGDDQYGQITDKPSGTNFIAIDAGATNSVALKSDGSLIAWGGESYNYSDQMNVPSGNDFIAVAMGSYQSVALRSDGSLEAWGDSFWFEESAPSGTGFIHIAAGSNQNVAIWSADTGPVQPYVIGLCIPGDSLIEVESVQCNGFALWSDGISTNVTDDVIWQIVSGQEYCSFSGNVLYNDNHSDANQQVTINASYTSGGVKRTTLKNIVLQNSALVVTLTDLSISGEPTVPEGGSSSYTAMASWSDDTSTPVPANWSISNNAYGYFDGNILYNDNTSGSNQIVTITASYTIGDVMKVGEMNVILEGNASVITLTGLSIMGDFSIPEDSSESYIARASWSNGSTLDVTSNTIWSENSPYCSFSFFNKSKLYNKNNSGSNQKVTIYASYTSGDRTETASKDIYLLDSTSVITLTDLSISGKLSILEGGSCPYTATASWSDGLTMNVTGETTWSLSNDDYCYFSGNMLYNDNTSGGNQTATITARYTSDGITLDKTQKVMLYGSNRIEGSIVTWGYDSSSQDFGAIGKDFVKVTTGGYHSIGLRADDSVVACGLYNAGQCDVPMPNVDFMTVAAGDYHSLGLKADGSIVAWGAGQPGQSGYNDYEQCNVPFPNCEFVDIAACDSHSLGLKSDGSVVAWGQTYGGVNDVPAVNTDFVQVTTGINLSAGLKNDGSISVWGQNYTGEYDAPAPNADFIAVAAGGLHLLGLKDNGSIVAWGNNYRGQCNVPAPNSNFVAIAASDLHSLGLKADGSIVAWGYNKDGQCDVPSPNAGFVAISADGSTSAAIRDASQSQTEQFLLTVDQKGEGIISAESGSYESGEIVTIHVTPAEGWRVKGWHGTNNDSSMNLTNTVTMYSDKTVTVEFEEIPIDGLSISKVTIKAGKDRNSSLDSIQITGYSFDIPYSDFMNAESVYMCVSYMDSPEDEAAYVLWEDTVNRWSGKYLNGVYNYRINNSNGNVAAKLDLNKNTFSINLRNINLSGCKAPVILDICIGDYYSSGIAYDGGVLGSGGVTDVINGKKAMPIQFLSGVENSLRVDKCTFRLGTKKPSTDRLTIQGAITVDDTSINIAKEDVHVTWGDYEVVLPADDLYRIGYKQAYKFKKPRGSDTSVAAAIFDLEKCTFKIAINKANIGYMGSPVDFGIAFDSFDETTEVVP